MKGEDSESRNLLHNLKHINLRLSLSIWKHVTDRCLGLFPQQHTGRRRRPSPPDFRPAPLNPKWRGFRNCVNFIQSSLGEDMQDTGLTKTDQPKWGSVFHARSCDQTFPVPVSNCQQVVFDPHLCLPSRPAVPDVKGKYFPGESYTSQSVHKHCII